MDCSNRIVDNVFTIFSEVSRHGEKVGKNPWGAATLEWTTPSPPPTANFLTEPKLTRGPYEYKGIEEDEQYT